jgi:hypothetical protein
MCCYRRGWWRLSWIGWIENVLIMIAIQKDFAVWRHNSRAVHLKIVHQLKRQNSCFLLICLGLLLKGLCPIFAKENKTQDTSRPFIMINFFSIFMSLSEKKRLKVKNLKPCVHVRNFEVILSFIGVRRERELCLTERTKARLERNFYDRIILFCCVLEISMNLVFINNIMV